MKLNDRVAVVTGGGRGIGREIALALSQEGANVVVSGRQLDVLEQTVTEIETQGRRALAIVTDVSRSLINELINKTLATFGRVDVLVNNAGIAGPTAAVTNPESRSMGRGDGVNLTGAFLCSRAVIPHERAPLRKDHQHWFQLREDGIRAAQSPMRRSGA